MKLPLVALATLLALSIAVNVCDPRFVCESDLDCLAPIERVSQPFRCIQGKCERVGCLTDLDCDPGLVCVDANCQPVVPKPLGEACNVTIGYNLEGYSC